MSEPVDADARKRALDPTCSFIVQAPAGSGKTELLTQRFLRLLAHVEQPEEVVALTFTRKAAYEMRDRILSALQQIGKNVDLVESDNDRLRLQLATKVINRDSKLHWDLLANPQRLRVMTIDAFNGGLVRQMPLTAQLGASLNTTDRAFVYYRDAARRTLEFVLLDRQEHNEYRGALTTLLRYFDNRTDRVEQQLVSMLQKREQWLIPIGATMGVNEDSLRIQLEQNWRTLVETKLAALCRAIPPGLTSTLPSLVRFAADQRRILNAESSESILLDLSELPGSDWGAVTAWSALADLLLVSGKAATRKTVTKTQGFPSGKEHAEKKQAILEILTSLNEHENFVHLLHGVRSLPSGGFSNDRWELLSALRKVLLLSVAQLQLEFAAAGKIDHSENTLRALQALGSDEEPTDLALSLDYRIKHLLIDEFQDTSVSQFLLLERLVRGWQSDDGRTLFLVGDPMQSIYRFRQAEVGEFLRARQYGVGDISLASLTLTHNFRSAEAVVNWVNSTFQQVFDSPEDLHTGSVKYTPSTAQHKIGSAGISVYPTFEAGTEAELVVETIKRCRKSDPKQTIAVLVRSRSHLAGIYPLLNRDGIPYQNIDIEKLADLPVVEDLLSLTRALNHIGDDISWLSILRAPWCGMSLADLLVLREMGQLVSTVVLDQTAAEKLSDAGQDRFRYVQSVIRPCIDNARRVPLARLVRSCWLQLGGPSCIASDQERAAADCFFELLATAASGGGELAIQDFSEQLRDNPAPISSDTDGSLQLMTIHKSKGLEFDTVLVPNLGRRGRNDDSPPIKWLQDVDGSLLLAPVKRPDEPTPDSMCNVLSGIERLKQDNELKRLLYVAVTRAKFQVHLFGHANIGKSGLAPNAQSLLQITWPQVKPLFESAFDVQDKGDAEKPADVMPPPVIRRLPAEWRLPAPGCALAEDSDQLARNLALANNTVEFDWAGEAARCIGTVVHHYLQRIADDGIEHWTAQRVLAGSTHISAKLQEEGLPAANVESAVQRCIRAITNTLDDSRGQWILTRHADAASEFSVAGIVDGGEPARRFVIDRTFVDEQGTRWIVDYKTGDHRGSGLEQFLDREQERYREQLDNYAMLMKHIDSRPIKLGLYFPMVRGWRQWSLAS